MLCFLVSSERQSLTKKRILIIQIVLDLQPLKSLNWLYWSILDFLNLFDPCFFYLGSYTQPNEVSHVSRVSNHRQPLIKQTVSHSFASSHYIRPGSVSSNSIHASPANLPALASASLHILPPPTAGTIDRQAHKGYGHAHANVLCVRALARSRDTGFWFVSTNSGGEQSCAPLTEGSLHA